jgi:hypothetical protein
VHSLAIGADCLKWAPRALRTRDIDLIGFGRIPAQFHTHFVDRFHRAESDHLYLHSPLGHLQGATVRAERGMLYKLLHRSRFSLAFHMDAGKNETGRPMSGEMVTSRWLESLLAGCIVVGMRPVSKMADDLLFWPQCTIELDPVPERAGEELQALLSSEAGWEAQRRSNIHHSLLHMDWRWRILTMCDLFELPVPSRLTQDLESIQAMARAWQ